LEKLNHKEKKYIKILDNDILNRFKFVFRFSKKILSLHLINMKILV